MEVEVVNKKYILYFVWNGIRKPLMINRYYDKNGLEFLYDIIIEYNDAYYNCWTSDWMKK